VASTSNIFRKRKKRDAEKGLNRMDISQLSGYEGEKKEENGRTLVHIRRRTGKGPVSSVESRPGIEGKEQRKRSKTRRTGVPGELDSFISKS